MRNYNSKTHVKPMTQNSFKKSDRQYPQTKKLQGASNVSGNTEMIAQTVSKRRQALVGGGNLGTPQTVSKTNKVLATVTSTLAPLASIPSGMYCQRYHVLLQNAFPINDRHSQQQIVDSTCLWFRNIQRAPLKEGLQLIFRGTQYIVGQWVGDGYPHIIFVTVDGIWGYMDQNGKSTNRVMALKLREIQPTVQQPLTFQLRYSATGQTKWQIPSDLTHIKMGLKVDSSDSQLQLPLPNPMVLQFEIKQRNVK